MAFFDRHRSAPSLINTDEDNMVVRTFSRHDTDLSDEDSIASEPNYERPRSSGQEISGVSLSLSESEPSPTVERREWNKKRRAPPPPPHQSLLHASPGSLRHSYAFEHSNRTSTDSESLSLSYSTTSSTARFVYQTSTDSDNLTEASGGSLLPTPDQEQPPSLIGQASPQFSPRDKSRLQVLKNALKSPRNLRKGSRKEHHRDKDNADDSGKAFRIRKHATIEPPDCSAWTLAVLPDDIRDVDVEFEVY
nr:hypothetical protein BaRGS_020531 [Batillaria attramentaria]